MTDDLIAAAWALFCGLGLLGCGIIAGASWRCLRCWRLERRDARSLPTVEIGHLQDGRVVVSFGHRVEGLVMTPDAAMRLGVAVKRSAARALERRIGETP